MYKMSIYEQTLILEVEVEFGSGTQVITKQD